MRLNSGQPASERREGVKPRLALIGGVEAGATIADIQTTAATEQLLPLNPANRRIRTRTYGGVGGEESQGSPLSRFKSVCSGIGFGARLRYGREGRLAMPDVSCKTYRFVGVIFATKPANGL